MKTKLLKMLITARCKQFRGAILRSKWSKCQRSKVKIPGNEDRKGHPFSFVNNLVKCWPILIIITLSHSQMNFRKAVIKIYHFTLNLLSLPHYLAKIECLTAQLFTHIARIPVMHTADVNVTLWWQIRRYFSLTGFIFSFITTHFLSAMLFNITAIFCNSAC